MLVGMKFIFLFSFKMAISTTGSGGRHKKSGSVGLEETHLFFFGLRKADVTVIALVSKHLYFFNGSGVEFLYCLHVFIF